MYIFIYIMYKYIIYDSIPHFIILYTYTIICVTHDGHRTTEHKRLIKYIICNYVFKNDENALHMLWSFIVVTIPLTALITTHI